MYSIHNFLAYMEGGGSVDPAYHSSALPCLPLSSLTTPKPLFLEPSASFMPPCPGRSSPLLKRPLATTFRLTNLFLQSEAHMCYLEEPSPTPAEEAAAASVPQTEPQHVPGHSNVSLCIFIRSSRAEAVSSSTQSP